MSKQQAAAAIIAFIVLDEDESKKMGKTRNWIKRRPLKGVFANIVQELRLEDTHGFKEMMRINYETFLLILSISEAYISPEQSYCGNQTVK